MLGRRVSGYEVKSILGGGRRTLYLAVSPDGHRAALRALAEDDTGASFTEFANEVSAALELTRRPEVVTRTLDDGREVLVALIDPGAPGTGVTRFPETTRLERLPKPRRSRLPLIGLALALLLLGLGVWRRLASQPPPVSEKPEPPAAVAATPKPVVEPAPKRDAPPANTPVVTPEPELAGPRVVEPAPKRESPPARAPPRTAVVVTREPEAACEPTDEWKKHRRADLQELDDRIQRSDTLWRQEQPHLDRVSSLILRARDAGDCREVEAELRKLVSRIIGPQ